MLKPIVPQIIRPALKQPALKACLFINSISSTPFNHFKKQTYKLTYWLVYPHSAHTNKPIDRHPVVFLCLKLNNISSHLLIVICYSDQFLRTFQPQLIVKPKTPPLKQPLLLLFLKANSIITPPLHIIYIQLIPHKTMHVELAVYILEIITNPVKICFCHRTVKIMGS